MAVKQSRSVRSSFRASVRRSVSCERGTVLALTTLGVFVMLGMVALAVDVGMLLEERTKLQATADAAAMAAAQDLPNEPVVKATAVQYADLNHPGYGTLVDSSEVKIGTWDGSARTFYPDSLPPNAVEVFVRRNTTRGNAHPTIFARVMGWNEVDVEAHAIAAGASSGISSRFILDEEMFDSDIPILQQIGDSVKAANGGNGNAEDVINDLDGDWIIDLHKYVTAYGDPISCSGASCSLTNPTTLELPTGQVGDEGMFDMFHDDFPFADGAPACATLPNGPATGSNPCSFTDFLNYNEDSNSWRYSLIDKTWLDPLLGVEVANNTSQYPYSGPFGGSCQASPVYKSDVSELNPVGVKLAPAANALGWRRGLVIFRIVGLGDDPDGPGGSVLPNLQIQICDPSELGPGGIASITLGQGSSYVLVD